MMPIMYRSPSNPDDQRRPLRSVETRSIMARIITTVAVRARTVTLRYAMVCISNPP